MDIRTNKGNIEKVETNQQTLKYPNKIEMTSILKSFKSLFKKSSQSDVPTKRANALTDRRSNQSFSKTVGISNTNRIPTSVIDVNELVYIHSVISCLLLIFSHPTIQ